MKFKMYAKITRIKTRTRASATIQPKNTMNRIQPMMRKKPVMGPALCGLYHAPLGSVWNALQQQLWCSSSARKRREGQQGRGRREEGREGGRKGGKEGGREGRREEGREGERKGGKEVGKYICCQKMDNYVSQLALSAESTKSQKPRNSNYFFICSKNSIQLTLRGGWRYLEWVELT